MGNNNSSGSEDKSNSSNCFITESGEHVTRGEIIEAGAAQARLEDTESPCPIADSVIGFIEAKDVNWDATPDRITGKCEEH